MKQVKVKTGIVVPATRPMIYKEARECADRINANLSNVRQDVIDLHDRDGWDALGYSCWTECVQKEFQQAERYIFYQYKAAQIEQNINDSAKTNCTRVQLGTIPEKQLRPLSKLEPQQQREAWQQAVATAPDGKVTASIVSKIVKKMTAPETAQTEKVISPMGETEDREEIYAHEEFVNADDFKAVSAAYSADHLSEGKGIRKPFNHNGQFQSIINSIQSSKSNVLSMKNASLGSKPPWPPGHNSEGVKNPKQGRILSRKLSKEGR